MDCAQAGRDEFAGTLGWFRAVSPEKRSGEIAVRTTMVGIDGGEDRGAIVHGDRVGYERE